MYTVAYAMAYNVRVGSMPWTIWSPVNDMVRVRAHDARTIAQATGHGVHHKHTHYKRTRWLKACRIPLDAECVMACGIFCPI